MTTTPLEDRSHVTGSVSVTLTSQLTDLPKASYTKKLKEFLTEMEGKSISILIENGLAYEIVLRRQGKKLSTEFKQISEDKFELLTNKKIVAYNQFHGIITSSIACTGSIIFACAPLFGLAASQQVLAGLQAGWQAADRSIQQVDKQYDYRDQASHTSIDALREFTRDNKSEITESLRKSEQQKQDIEGKLERMNNFMLELMRTLSN